MKKVFKLLDYPLVFSLIVTIIFGILMMYSVSSIVAVKNYGYSGDFFFRSQLNKLFLGVIGLIICIGLPFHIWKKRIVSVCIVIVSIVLLFLVLWKGKVVNNAQSWIFGIQPAELIKMGVIIVLAGFFSKRQEVQKSYWQGSGKVILLLMFTFFLIYKQPNLGSALLISGIGASMFICSGINIFILMKWIAVTSIVWVPTLYFLFRFGLSDVQMARITTVFNPFLDAKGDGYQLVNSFITIGSGGVSGRGYGNSIQKEGFLPEPHTDFIMSIVSEELGIIGVLIILTGLLTIVLRSFKIVQECKSQFGSLISIEIGSMIGLQSIANLGGVTGMFPLTGTPLPFISFGGSSLMANLIAMGLLINISIFNKKNR
ncbi:FtsW/RodA/SpoVE family cell cycle protein [Bacillus mycoides]|uniref:FtsW/RodA/SpoVE family cell cycle protein n=2 Tax=Bacillus mycoides TaxID=1405 RepID=UPI00346398D2